MNTSNKVSKKSLSGEGNQLSNNGFQLEILNQSLKSGKHPAFSQKMEQSGLFPLKPKEIEVFQINMGKMCNQVCRHCHVDAGPDRKEIMTRETMDLALKALAVSSIQTVDLTGGAPEMNPDFRWFVKEISNLGRKIIVRCNLTIILANKKFHDLPEFFARHQVEVVSSLPFYTSRRTDSQRGDGVFEQSVKALKLLNAVGYGTEGSGLVLNLVYNPTGALLPGSQAGLENDFKKALTNDHGIVFNNLFAITNIPISRFLDYLIASGNYEGYMDKLVNAFNPEAAKNVMCRNTLSIGWDGFIYDCDFNQMLDLKVADRSVHLRDFDQDALKNRNIVLNQHCYGCTAGAGSSCGGEVV